MVSVEEPERSPRFERRMIERASTEASENVMSIVGTSGAHRVLFIKKKSFSHVSLTQSCHRVIFETGKEPGIPCPIGHSATQHRT